MAYISVHFLYMYSIDNKKKRGFLLKAFLKNLGNMMFKYDDSVTETQNKSATELLFTVFIIVACYRSS